MPKYDFSTIKDIQNMPNMESFAKYLIYGTDISQQMMNHAPLEKIVEMTGWNMDSIAYGVERVRQIANAGIVPVPVYTESECKQDKQMRDVNIVHFPACRKDPNKPYVIVIAGGAYMSVCSLVEAYPVAARFNEMGYDAFVLTYRVGGIGLLPKPVDDLAAAVRYIRVHAQQFEVNQDQYIVCGFSAGANLTALWGTHNYGYMKYHLPKPVALFPIYAFTTASLLNRDDKMTRKIIKLCYGKHPSEEHILSFDIDSHADVNYPPTYLCCNQDDNMVDYRHSVRLYEHLKGIHVPVELEMGEAGGHGFGEGLGLQVDQWYMRAMQFVCKTAGNEYEFDS